MNMDLSANYGGLVLRSPIVVGACPISVDESTRISLEDAGAGAIVLPSLFEEQVIRWSQKIGQRLSQAEQELLQRSERIRTVAACENAEDYLALVNRASSQLNIPVIASLNGYTVNRWLDFAAELQEAGAEAIELNVHRPANRAIAGAEDLEDEIAAAVVEIKRSISVPLFLKIERDYVNIPHLARRVCSGAAGLVLYGRKPDVDICLDSLRLNMTWRLTTPGRTVKLIAPLMQAHGSCPALSIAASGGIASGEDVIKVLLAGADVAMVTSEIYRGGPDVIRTLLDGLTVFLEKHHFRSLRELQLHRPIEFASDEERTAYMEALSGRLYESHTPATEVTVTGDRWGHMKTNH